MNEFLVLLGFAAGLVTQLRLAYADCHVCEGTGSEVCIWCDGTGNDSVYKGQPCVHCRLGRKRCGHCDGRSYRKDEYTLRWRDL